MLSDNMADFTLFDKKNHPCNYYLGSFTIKPDGEVSLCPTLPISFGNIYNQSLCEIIQGKRFENFKEIKISHIKKCVQCKYLNLCGGGCRADALFLRGNICQEDPRSCLNMKYFEKFIIPVLPIKTQENIIKLFNTY